MLNNLIGNMHILSYTLGAVVTTPISSTQAGMVSAGGHKASPPTKPILAYSLPQALSVMV